MSKAKPAIALGSTSQRDLFHFALNPPPTPAIIRPSIADVIRFASKTPRASMQTIEASIQAIGAEKPAQRPAQVEIIPVAARATVGSRVLETAFKCFKRVTNDIALEFTPEGLRVAATDPEHRMLCRTTLRKAGFAVYDTEGETITFPAEIKPLVRALARAGREKGRDITIRVGQGGTALRISFLVATGIRHAVTFKRAAITASVDMDLHAFGDKMHPWATTTETEVLARALKDANLTSDLVRISFVGGHIRLAAADERNDYDAAIPLKTCEGAPDSAECGLFNAGDLAEAAKTLGAFKIPRIAIRAGAGVPISLRAESETMMLEFMLAPRVETDDDEDGEDETETGDDGGLKDDDAEHVYCREDAALPGESDEEQQQPAQS